MVGLYWRTVRHLTPRQLVYQVWNRLRQRPRLRWSAAATDALAVPFPITFTFLNQSVTFTDRVDWNYATNGKLWTYNLTYFEFLNPPHAVDRATGLALIHDFIRQTDHLLDALEPYPTSLRILNWRAFLRREGIQEPLIEQYLYAQTALLRSRLEYHLGGNHLLENACALTIMAVHFQHRAWFNKGAALLRDQLAEQILSDGGHYERSPVYHQLLTDRLLDVYTTLQADTWANTPALISYVRTQTSAMLNWLVAITFRNGSVPMVNDSAYGVAPTTAELLAKARMLDFAPIPARLTDSGYRMLTTSRLEVFIDVGPVGPDHQPGHAHADTFSFILHLDGNPIIIDPGTSTYQSSERRQWERSTAAHNTVTVDGQNSSEVWGGFRVGRRVSVQVLTDTAHCLEATHFGYNYLGEQHTRRWVLTDEHTLRIIDQFSNEKILKTYRLYFADYLSLTVARQQLQLAHCTLSFTADTPLTIQLAPYEQALGFNCLSSTPRCLMLDFTYTVTTLFTAHL